VTAPFFMQSSKILSSFHLALTLKKRMLNATGEGGVQVAMATMVIMAATMVTMTAIRDGFRDELNKLSTKNCR